MGSEDCVCSRCLLQSAVFLVRPPRVCEFKTIEWRRVEEVLLKDFGIDRTDINT